MKKKHTLAKKARRKNQGGLGIRTPKSWQSPVAYTVATNLLKILKTQRTTNK